MRRQDHKDLIVWQKAMDMAQSVHQLTMSFPKHELFGLASQIRRAAVSIPSNIAEGAARGGTPEFIHFLHIARGSLAELDTQLRLAKNFGYIVSPTSVSAQLNDVGRLINAIIRGLRKRSSCSSISISNRSS